MSVSHPKGGVFVSVSLLKGGPFVSVSLSGLAQLAARVSKRAGRRGWERGEREERVGEEGRRRGGGEGRVTNR